MTLRAFAVKDEKWFSLFQFREIHKLNNFSFPIWMQFLPSAKMRNVFACLQNKLWNAKIRLCHSVAYRTSTCSKLLLPFTDIINVASFSSAFEHFVNLVSWLVVQLSNLATYGCTGYSEHFPINIKCSWHTQSVLQAILNLLYHRWFMIAKRVTIWQSVYGRHCYSYLVQYHVHKIWNEINLWEWNVGFDTVINYCKFVCTLNRQPPPFMLILYQVEVTAFTLKTFTQYFLPNFPTLEP